MKSIGPADEKYSFAPQAQTRHRADVIDWLLLILPGCIWGASFLFIAEGLDAVGPNGVTFVRIAVGFLTLSLVPAARRPIRRSDRSGAAALGIVWLAFPLSMFPFAEQHVSSALTGMLNGATPLFAAAVAAGLARRMPPPAVLAWVLLAGCEALVHEAPGGGAVPTADILHALARLTEA